ncbi:MAG: clan AA aspartic protease [Cyanobacteria bacterium P01_D01_bin.1]
MMQGFVDQRCEARIRLAVGNTSGQRQMIDALIDTGFTGFLMLSLSVIQQLDLNVYRREVGILADGSRRTFDVYRGLVIWDGERRSVDCNASEADSLVGMSLLYGYRMQIDITEGSTIIISKLPS